MGDRAVRPGRLVLLLLIVAGLFAAAVGAGYILGQSAFRSLPVPSGGAGARSPSTPSGVSAASGGVSSGASGTASGSAGLPSVPATTMPTPGAPGPSAPTTTTSPTPIPPGSPAPAETPSPSPPSPAPAPANAVPPSAPPTRFHVQVGAFDARQNAEALVLRLRALGYAVTLVDGPPYRVWVGGYVDQPTALRLADILGKAGFDAVLTPR